MSNFSKFDTQTQIEETNEYQSTAADLAEYAEWLDELDDDMPFPEDEEFQLSAPADYDGGEDSLGELETNEFMYDEIEDNELYEDYDGQPSEYDEWQDYMGGDEYYDHSESMGEW